MNVWTDDWRDATVHRQSEGACGGSEGPGGAGSSCEPSRGGSVGGVFWVGSACPAYVLWFVRMVAGVERWYARVYGVWWRAREVRRVGCCVCAGMHGCVCIVRGDAWKDVEGDDET